MTNQPTPDFYDPEACDLADFVECTSRTTASQDAPHAERIEKNIPVYDATALDLVKNRRTLMAEWAQIFLNGAGVIILKQAQTDHAAIDAATDIFNQIIADEKSADKADHFAAAGSNDRIWNSLQKLCLRDPETFIRYHASPAIDAACEAWLGPNYQLTAQVNLVHPGGAAQQAHRDYHLGFQTAEVSATYPAHVHDLSPLMTLQGGLAHGDTPIESGPTKLLPYSQTYRPGYATWRRADFRGYFEEHCVQLPLEKGDALFFNPALFHAAGANSTTDIHRLVNLFQIGSAFGRTLETVDRIAMCKALYDPLCQANLTPAQLASAIAASAEGYPFPTNLDTDPPVGGLAPESQAALLHRHIAAGSPRQVFVAELAAQTARKPA